MRTVSPRPTPETAPAPAEAPFRRARLAAGFTTQRELHYALGGDSFVTLRTIRRWDTGEVRNGPQDPRKARVVVEKLQKPAHEIWPDSDYAAPPAGSAAAPSPAVPAGPSTSTVENGRGRWNLPAFLGTADVTRPRPTRPRLQKPIWLTGRRTATTAATVVIATTLLGGGGAAVLASGSDDPPAREAARAVGPTPKQRAAAAATREIERGDYDAAIKAALSVSDTQRADEIRTQAVRILLERTDTAITTGKLGRARTLLGRAKTKYGDRLPDDSAARYTRIHKLEAEAAARAKARAAAKRRAAHAKARAKRAAAARAAAARRAAPSTTQARPNPGSSGSSTQSTPAPSTQSNPAPQSGGSTGSTGGGSSSGGSSGGGSSSKKPVDPGIY